jgi:hypothetical protein
VDRDECPRSGLPENGARGARAAVQILVDVAGDSIRLPKRLRALIASAERHHGVIAMFSEVKGRAWLPNVQELEREGGLRVVARVSDGELLAPND